MTMSLRKHWICKLEWCGKKYCWLWFCAMHYRRYKLYWDENFVRKRAWQRRENHYLYSTYRNMVNRCKYSYCSWKYYKDKWITVCNRWLWLDWFTNFISDMWDRPEWCSIDRIDWSKWYYKENCRRSNKYKQMNNRSNTQDMVWVYHWSKDSWEARISINGERIKLWRYKTRHEAVKARKDAEILYNVTY